MKITIEHENHVFHYEHGYQAYILDYALYHDIDKRYGIEGLKELVGLVSACYLKDENPTPLGVLTDFMAEHWEDIKTLSRYNVLSRLYSQLD